jgi:hypothetical protein
MSKSPFGAFRQTWSSNTLNNATIAPPTNICIDALRHRDRIPRRVGGWSAATDIDECTWPLLSTTVCIATRVIGFGRWHSRDSVGRTAVSRRVASGRQVLLRSTTVGGSHHSRVWTFEWSDPTATTEAAWPCSARFSASAVPKLD